MTRMTRLFAELASLAAKGSGHLVARAGIDGIQQWLPALVHRLTEDDLLESLLLLHDLHPLDVDTRVQRALDRVRPYLGSHAGGVDLLGVDQAGMVHLRLEGTCHGCPSSTVTVKLAIERAIEEAAPEVAGVQVEGVVAERDGLLQIRPFPRQAPGPCPVPVPTEAAVVSKRS